MIATGENGLRSHKASYTNTYRSYDVTEFSHSQGR